MTNLLQSVFILLDSILYNVDQVGYSRAEFTSILAKKNLPNSPTAISRVLEYINKNYQLKLKFERHGGCYILEDQSDPKALENVNFYKQLFLKDHIQRMFKDYEYTKDIISFSFDTENKNSHLLSQILEAILNRRYVKFIYKKFYSSKSKNYVVAPFYIKEYLNRWYLLAKSDKSESQIFPLDRMKDFELLDSKHQFEKKSIKTIFENTIGVDYSGDLLKVKLWTDKDQYPYFETLPLHHSQKLEQETEDGFIFSIEVTYNYELKRWLLYYGSRVEVLEPKSLRDEIKNEMENALSRYK